MVARTGSANVLGSWGLMGEEPWKVQLEQQGVPPEVLPKGHSFLISSNASCLYLEWVVRTRLIGVVLILRGAQVGKEQ